MTKYIILITVFVMFISVSVLAQPSIVSVGGSIVDGQTVDISGTGFGTNALGFEWTGDHIDSAQSGEVFKKDNWIVYEDTTHNDAVQYTNSKYHSSPHSLHSDFYGDKYDSFFSYDTGDSGITESYMTTWIRLDKNDDSTKFQWKNFRLSNESNLSANKSALAHNWWWYAENGPRINDWAANPSQIYTTDVETTRNRIFYPPTNAFEFGKWIRIEIYCKKSSSPGVPDGILKWKRVDLEDYREDLAVMTHSENDEPWRYHLIGMYYGNLAGGIGVRDMDMYYDDIYISNTQARVEIGNAETWDGCTHREIQIPVEWSDGSIKVKLNKGSFTSEKAYLYIVDNQGIVNPDGYVIEFETTSIGTPTLKIE